MEERDQGVKSMPQTVTQNSLAAILGDRGRKAYEAHKKDDVRMGFIDLPPGINNGIARLDMCKVDKYGADTRNPGKPYVLFRGIAVIPKEHNGVPVEGQGVMIRVDLFDNPTKQITDRNTKQKRNYTLEDGVRNLINELKKLDASLDETAVDHLDAILAHLQKVKPYFRFSTRAFTPTKTANNPNPTPIPVVNYNGRCNYSPTTSPMSALTDGTAQPNGASSNGPAVAVSSADEADAFDPDTTPLADETSVSISEKELQSLLTTARKKGNAPNVSAAQKRLLSLAQEAGYTKEEAESDSIGWDDVADMIRNPKGERESASGEEELEEEASADAETEEAPESAEAEEAEEAAEDESLDEAEEEEEQQEEGDWPPQTGLVFKYKVTDPKSGKKRVVDVEVLTVNEEKETVTLKNLDTNKTITNEKKQPIGVKWANLIRDEE